MAYNLGNAYIEIVPSTKGLGKGIEKELSGVGGRASKQMGGKLWGGLKAGALGAGVAIGGILTGSIAKGFGRLTAIENAEAKLSGLGNSAEDVQKIMDNALKAVKGTAFGMDEAATTAASAVAAGIKPGMELEKYLSLVGDAASIAGTDMSTMGSIFNKVATSGKVQGDVFAQLGDAGIPIVTLLAEEMGVTAEEVYKLGSAGKIGTDEFLKAMGSMEGAALESGKTTTGAMKNAGAAMGRFGAALIEDVYPYVAPLMGKITELFDYLTDAAGPAIDRIVEKIKPFAQGIKGVFDILTNGDFTGADNLFGFEEDSAFVGFLFTLRDAAIELYNKALKPFGEWWMAEAPKFLPVIGKLAGAIGAVIAVLAGGALATVIGAFMAQVALAVGVIWPALTKVVEFIEQRVWPVFKDVFGRIWEVLKLVAQVVVGEVWPVIKSAFESIRDLAVQVWQGVVLPAFEQFTGFLRDSVMPIVQRLWTDYIQPAFMAIGGLAVWLWNNAIKPAFTAISDFVGNTLGPALVWLWENVVSPVFTAIGNFIGWAWENVIFPALDALKYFLFEVLPPAFEWLWKTVKSVWDSIKRVIGAVVGWFQTWAWPVISLVIELIKLGFNTMRAALKTAWDFIKDRVINPVVTWFRDTAWPIISSVIDSIKTAFNVMRDALKAAWSFIRDKVIEPVANWFRDKIEPLFKTATDSTGKAFSAMKDTIKKAWDGIKDAAKAPIRFVVDTVMNDALIGNFNKLAKKLGTGTLPPVSLPSGFARGGVLPGMSRMSDGDDQLVPMRRGEGVLVSEGLRTAKDRAAFLAANAAGRRGIGFASLMGGGFAGGGILDKVKGLGGDALDAITSGAEWIGSALADPKGAFKKIVDGLMGQVPGAGLMRDAAIAIPKRIASEIGDKLFGAVGDGGGGSVPQSGAGGVGWARASGAASALGLRMTSGYRSGARTAGSGSRSLHSMGRARDYAGSASSMRAFFNAMDAAPYPTELLYTPMGSRNIHRGGGRYANTGATARGHWDHVHVGFRKGGIFDQGGMMQPGMTGINLTKKPEAVLDPRMTRAYQVHAEALAAGGGAGIQIGTVQGFTAEEVAGAIERERRKREALYAR